MLLSMLLSIVKMLRGIVRTFTEKDAPRRVAFGFALGLMIGLVPKGNLVAIVLSVVLLGTRANLVAGGLAALLFTWVGALVDPLTHRVGLALLTRPSWEPAWTWLFNLPLVPWTRLNNTVVLGSLLLGLALFYPAYRLARLAMDRYRDRLAEKIAEYYAAEASKGAEIGASWRVR